MYVMMETRSKVTLLLLLIYFCIASSLLTLCTLTSWHIHLLRQSDLSRTTPVTVPLPPHVKTSNSKPKVLIDHVTMVNSITSTNTTRPTMHCISYTPSSPPSALLIHNDT